uniref:SH2_2 domain-containing protein n=1 Tax=Toxocara canis TaxID=6265 RepID=A0A183U1C6_TOXCA
LNADDEIFMTEEFNELTWKKKIIDPRIPESERQFGGKIISSLPLGAAQREYLKFAKTREVERPISVEQYDDDVVPMMRALSNGKANSAARNRSRSGRSRQHRPPLYADSENSVISKFNNAPWELIKDSGWQSGEKLEFTQTEEIARNLHAANTVSALTYFRLSIHAVEIGSCIHFLAYIRDEHKLPLGKIMCGNDEAHKMFSGDFPAELLSPCDLCSLYRPFEKSC